MTSNCQSHKSQYQTAPRPITVHDCIRMQDILLIQSNSVRVHGCLHLQFIYYRYMSLCRQNSIPRSMRASHTNCRVTKSCQEFRRRLYQQHRNEWTAENAAHLLRTSCQHSILKPSQKSIFRGLCRNRAAKQDLFPRQHTLITLALRYLKQHLSIFQSLHQVQVPV
jgi:hypothetical protein